MTMNSRPYLQFAVRVPSQVDKLNQCASPGCYLCDSDIPHRPTDLFSSPLVVVAPTHKQRRSQSDQYHYRVQKKWDARFEDRTSDQSEIRSAVALPLSGQRPYCKINVQHHRREPI